MKEEWRDVVGYEGLYQVSNHGKVRSRKRDKILSPKNNHDGYLRIQLWTNCKARFISIHRLVAQSFILNPKNKPFVNHKDGNKQNNYVENLEWVTQQENIIHAWKTGLSKTKLNNVHPQSVDQLDLEGNLIKTYPSTMEAQRQTGIQRTSISAICRNYGHSKTAGGFKWRYNIGDVNEL